MAYNTSILNDLSGTWRDRDGAPIPVPSIVDIVTKPVVALGVFNDPLIPADAAAFTATAGEVPTLALDFIDYTSSLNVSRLQGFRKLDQDPIIGWMPQDGSNLATQPAYQLIDIINGTHDTYMTTFLLAIKQLGYPVYIRWAHEMNGNWYPWSEGVNGNTTGQYATAWRHVHDLADSLGVTNIAWIWTVSTNYPGSTRLAGLYPGDAYVDVVAVNGYNWGATGPSGWVTPGTIFDDTITEIQTITMDKPLWITEVGCAPDDGGSKPAWFGQFFDWILTTRVEAFIYFNAFRSGVPGEKDWRVTSAPSPTSADAFHAEMADFRERTRRSGQDARHQLVGPVQMNTAINTALVPVTARLNRTATTPNSLWAGGNCETMPRFNLSDIPGVSGRLSAMYVVAPATVTITKLAVVSSSVAAVTQTVARLALFTIAANGNLTKVAQTANTVTLGSAQYTEYQQALSTAGGFPASYTLIEGQRYAFGWLSVAATSPSLHGANTDFAYLEPFLCRTITGQSDIASSYTDVSLSSFWQPLFIAGIK